jgi:hypothetical protein
MSGCGSLPDDLFARARERIKAIAASGNWAAPKGKPKYMLSGLLRGASCGAHYVIANKHEFSCSSYVNGRACSNGIRARRVDLEREIVEPLNRDLLAPQRIERRAKEMQAEYLEWLRATRSRAGHASRTAGTGSAH